MADVNINTQSAGYQTRLTQLQEIKQFYGPLIVEWLKSPPTRQEKWRAKDPIMDEMLDIYERIHTRSQSFG